VKKSTQGWHPISVSRWTWLTGRNCCSAISSPAILTPLYRKE
jgi:hypothetical protein